jgi:acyl-CoA synthetase (AMP-forming)/AMP-acid ligase II
VIAAADPKWGETLMAIIVPRAGRQPTKESIIAHSVTLIASYKKPHRVVFVDAAAAPERQGGQDQPA